MTEIITITLSFVLGVLLTRHHWRTLVRKKALDNTAIVVDGEIYYVVHSEDYYKVYLKGCKYDTN